MQRPLSGGVTATVTLPAAPPVVRFFLVPEPAPARRVAWDDSVQDNEGLGKRSSKKCCVFHKKRAFDESSDEDCSSDGSEGGGGGGGGAGGGGGGGGAGSGGGGGAGSGGGDGDVPALVAGSPPPPPVDAADDFRPDGAQPTASARRRLQQPGRGASAAGSAECPHCRAIEELRARGKAGGGGGGGGGGVPK
jgi:protein phosphatase 1 regulatory subunit 11